jgi:hypothetical protein
MKSVCTSFKSPFTRGEVRNFLLAVSFLTTEGVQPCRFCDALLLLYIFFCSINFEAPDSQQQQLSRQRQMEVAQGQHA